MWTTRWAVGSSDCDDTDATINPAGLFAITKMMMQQFNGWWSGWDLVCWRWWDGFGNANSRQQAQIEDSDSMMKIAMNAGQSLLRNLRWDDNGVMGILLRVTTTWYVDNDFDSYGDPNDTVESCTEVEGRGIADCNDGTAAVYPGAWILQRRWWLRWIVMRM